MFNDILFMIVLIMFIYLFYIFEFRGMYIRKKYKINSGICIQEDMDNNSLMQYLKDNEFRYPDLKDMYYDENGQVTIAGKYTSHPLRIEDKKIYVERSTIRGTTNARYIEEAHVIESYLSKLFNPQIPINPYDEYEKFKSVKLKKIGVVILLPILFFIVMYIDEDSGMKDIVDSVSSSAISESHLTEYSDKVTVGKAFNDFFSDPEWKSYKQGIQEYVDFKGKCLLDEEEVSVVITFTLFDDMFKVDSAKINGEEMNALEIKAMLNAIYSDV